MYIEYITVAGRTAEVLRTYRWPVKGIRSSSRGPASEPKRLEYYAKVNKVNAHRKLTRILNANFDDADMWVTFTVDPAYGLSHMDAYTEFGKFRHRYKYFLSRHGVDFKYVYAVGEKEKIPHIHLITSCPADANMDEVFERLWKFGYVRFRNLDPSGNYHRVSSYIIKHTDATFRTGACGMKKRFQCSKGLVRPKPVIYHVGDFCWDDDPEVPAGYHLDYDTLYNGFDPITREKIQRFTIVKD
ncbi:MAG: hypothetical protein E7235_00955 [Lachnospiraceae bacterium]|nr:hypothetical protein [Lachnospiraceae bacterium]